MSVLIYTSSSSVSIRRVRLWLWPWEKQPPLSKNSQQLRTGCLRPGIGIYGTRGDILCSAYLARQVNPPWAQDILQNFIYVENVSLAHFYYEQLPQSNPDLGGQVFGIVDTGPPVTYGDLYTVLTTLTNGQTVLPRLSATAMLLLSHVLEGLHLLRPFLRRLSQFVPTLSAGLVNLQPPLFSLTTVHPIWDDSRGLGYELQWTTLTALCKPVQEHNKTNGRFEARSMSGGISLGLGRAWRRGSGSDRKVYSAQ
ncbi:hypothetical protein BGY98DRAFT_964306 [Russula aff. rugulosa BPL654]|nr:hypothetical protein BGY98DRAFT_964306 [Russula aff. rugulosa BPL654]